MMDDFNISNERIIDVDVEKEIRQSFLDYSMSVIVSRALPDVRDGLKPVHRRILYAMGEMGLTHEKPTRKCATVVGDVLGAYHPHGDMSVYNALVRLAQSFSLRYPLVEGQGNFGSVDGDPPAAYRYTEARMSRIAATMLTDIDKETVNFIPNFDDTTVEPEVLPARIPNLLVNGSNGIAVGMATNIPPHNLSEVISAIDYLIDNPDCNVFDLMDYIQGPDFPTGGIIMGRAGIRAAYGTGRGKIILRGRAESEEQRNGRFRILITEIPYMVNKAELIKSIADQVKDKKIEGISDLRDESDKKGMRIVIELKRDANPTIITNQLYKLTQLQESVGVIMLALDNGVPKVMDLKTMLVKYLEFQEEVIRRRTEFDLKKAKDRAHILEGLHRAVDIVDEIIATIRATKGGQQEAKLAIMEKFGFDDPQASAIVAFRLGQLAGLEILRIETELNELHEKIADLEDVLGNKAHLTRIIKEELEDIKNRFGDERRTEIRAVSGEVDIEDLIPNERCIITRTHFGYIKRQPVEEYRTQKRGGRGVSGLSRREDDFVEDMFSCSSHDYLLFMTNRGRVYSIKSYEIQESSRQSRGTNVVNILPITSEEKVSAVLKVTSFEDAKYLTMVTKKGLIKRTDLKLYSRIRKTGVIGIELNDGDELAWAGLTSGDDDLLVATKNGFALRFSEADARPMGRDTRGQKGVTLRSNDEVVGVAIVDETHKILTVTSDGRGRLSTEDNYVAKNRGGKGARNFECADGVSVAGVLSVDEDKDDVIMISENGTIVRMNVCEISTQSRTAKGVKVMRLDEGDSVVTVARTLREDAEEEIVEEAAEEEEREINAPSEEELMDEISGGSEADEVDEFSDDDEDGDM
ncbi:MAG: DNA gyrase subunit A [Oscillospiraceae bacterium]|nr:DNA gyrase subunit A [Oscillospiraceae bacterium]